MAGIPSSAATVLWPCRWDPPTTSAFSTIAAMTTAPTAKTIIATGSKLKHMSVRWGRKRFHVFRRVLWGLVVLLGCKGHSRVTDIRQRIWESCAYFPAELDHLRFFQVEQGYTDDFCKFRTQFHSKPHDSLQKRSVGHDSWCRIYQLSWYTVAVLFPYHDKKSIANRDTNWKDSSECGGGSSV